MSVVTIALAQIRTRLYDKKSNANRAVAILEECKAAGVDYVLFPEMFLTGYYIYDRVADLAESIDGPHIQMIQRKAEQMSIGVIFGFPEAKSSKFYNSAAFIERDGHLAGVYRKVHLFDKETGIYQPGEELPIFRTDYGNFGLGMTFDTGFPEFTRLYALQHAHILLFLHAHNVPYQSYPEILLRARALENQLFIAVANKVGLEHNSLFFGESSFVSPDGVYLFKGGNNEEIKPITINLGDVQRSREAMLMKYLENRRPRLYRQNELY